MSGTASLMVEAIGVRKHFAGVEVLKGVDLKVGRGEVACLIGPSGSGKSTFLRCINHLEKHDAGELLVDGQLVGYELRNGKLYERNDKQICAERARIGMVFQRFNLFPHMSAIENVVCAPVRVKREPVGTASDRARTLLDRVGLLDKVDAYPSQLSGGQQQRVAIARALVKQPAVLLDDEPTGNLDEDTRDEISGLLEGLWRERRLTLILISHDSAVVRRAQRIG